MKKYPKVLIVTVTYSGKDYCWSLYHRAIKKINYPNYDYLIVDNSDNYNYVEKLKSRGVKNILWASKGKNTREAILNSYMVAREYFLKGDYDIFFSVESDIIVHKDIIDKLLAHRRLVVTAPYYIEKDKKKMLLIEMLENNIIKILSPEISKFYLNRGLIQIDGTGLGCSMIHRLVIEKIPFRIKKDRDIHNDTFWNIDLKNNGIPIFMDTNIKPVRHIYVDWSETNRNKSYGKK